MKWKRSPKGPKLYKPIFGGENDPIAQFGKIFNKLNIVKYLVIYLCFINQVYKTWVYENRVS